MIWGSNLVCVECWEGVVPEEVRGREKGEGRKRKIETSLALHYTQPPSGSVFMVPTRDIEVHFGRVDNLVEVEKGGKRSPLPKEVRLQ